MKNILENIGNDKAVRLINTADRDVRIWSTIEIKQGNYKKVFKFSALIEPHAWFKDHTVIDIEIRDTLLYLGDMEITDIDDFTTMLKNGGLSKLAEQYEFSYDDIRAEIGKIIHTHPIYVLNFGQDKVWETLSAKARRIKELDYVIHNYDYVGDANKRNVAGYVINKDIPTREKLINILNKLIDESI